MMTTVVLNVPSISCGHCARTITSALIPVEGVSSVQVNISTKQVRVAYDETRTEVERLEATLQEKNYPVASVEAIKEVAEGSSCGTQEPAPTPAPRVATCSCCSL